MAQFTYAKPPTFWYATFDRQNLQFTSHPVFQVYNPPSPEPAPKEPSEEASSAADKVEEPAGSEESAADKVEEPAGGEESENYAAVFRTR